MKGKIFLLVSLLVIITGATITIWIFSKFNDELMRNKLAEISSETQLQGSEFKNNIGELLRDVRFLKGTPPVQGIIRAISNQGIDPFDGSPSEVWHARLAVIFSELLRAKSEYIQIRYIGLADNGREIVRVDRFGAENTIRIVPNEKLQQKGNRDYFKYAVDTPKGESYLSDIELNRENGEITLPVQPVIRAAVPVYEENGQAFGIIIINFDVSSSLEEAFNAIDEDHTYYVTNEKGDYIKHPDPHKAFRFEYGERSNAIDDFPELLDILDAKGNNEQLKHRSIQRDEIVISLRTIQYNPENPNQKIGIIAIDDYDDATVISRTVLQQTYFIIGGLIFFALLIGSWVAQKLSEPIMQITRAVKLYAEGKKNIYLPVHETGEAGILARVFQSSFQELSQKREELDRQRKYYESLINNMNVPVFVLNAEHKIIIWNKAIEEMTGIMEEQVIGTSEHWRGFYNEPRPLLADIVLDENFEIVEQFYPVELEPSLLPGTYKIENWTPMPVKGKPSYTAIEAGVIFDEQGKIFAVVEVLKDITSLKCAQEELKTRQGELEQSNKELEQFAYVASHDLQEPLRTVASYTQLLERRYAEKLDGKAFEFMGFIVDAAKRMQTLIDDLLLFSRVNVDMDMSQIVDLNEIYELVCDDLEKVINDTKAKITKDELPAIKGNTTQLRQLLQNLIGNALKYRSEQRLPEIYVGFTEDDGNQQFSVSDNGIGIESKYFERIFMIFQRLHGKLDYSGNGIGLALCKKIVERHGGNIWIESVPDKGTTLFFSIPNNE